jgi:hypothetical protein
MNDGQRSRKRPNGVARLAVKPLVRARFGVA